MGIYYQNLDERTREFMIKELETNISNDNLYRSPNLNNEGQVNWGSLLKESIQNHDDTWLATQLRIRNYIKIRTERKTPSGGMTTINVRKDAPDMLAEGQFNCFYIRGVCSRAIAEGISEVGVYRGKQVKQPRPESQAKIGTRINAQSLLDDLRETQGKDPSLKIPGGPNSGLTVRLP